MKADDVAAAVLLAALVVVVITWTFVAVPFLLKLVWNELVAGHGGMPRIGYWTALGLSLILNAVFRPLRVVRSS